MAVKGASQHSRRLQQAATRTPQEVARALYSAGQLVELDAERSITEGAVSGAGHVPSRPGDPPNADTHRLDSNIETEIAGPGLVTVTSRAPYSRFLEFGTSRMAARPFMRPALRRNLRRVRQMVGDAVRLTLR